MGLIIFLLILVLVLGILFLIGLLIRGSGGSWRNCADQAPVGPPHKAGEKTKLRI
ncbi:MAG: hypothetical protein ACUVQY_03970 [Thermoproteota archaeon]